MFYLTKAVMPHFKKAPAAMAPAPVAPTPVAPTPVANVA